jgi:hypothetical protein
MFDAKRCAQGYDDAMTIAAPRPADRRTVSQAPGPRARRIDARYDAPLDLLWIETARDLGITRIDRSATVFAAYDGAGTLTLASPETFDADDGLPQLIFHELCHALVEGPTGMTAADWGLSNVGDDDLPREWGCLRVQAALAQPHGLREVLAPTTDHRAYYDALPGDPLAPIATADGRDEAALAAAREGLARAARPPWTSPLQRALAITAQVATLIAPLAPEGSLWRRYRSTQPVEPVEPPEPLEPPGPAKH